MAPPWFLVGGSIFPNTIGIVDATYPLTAPCTDTSGNSLAGFLNPADAEGMNVLRSAGDRPGKWWKPRGQLTLVRRGLFDVVDDNHVDRSLLQIELQAELLLEGGGE